MFNRALSATEVNSIYKSGSAGKCKSAVNLPWDRPFCAGQQVVAGVGVGVCNYSTTPKTYNLTLTGLPAGTPGLPSACTVDGPSLFEKFPPITAIPPPVQVTVPANSCASVPIRIHRPTNMTALNQIGCYRADMQDSTTGAIVTAFGSVQDRRDVCPVVKYGGVNVTSPLQVNLGEVLNFSFQLENTSGGLRPLTYQIATMASDLSSGRNVVSLNGLDPGVPARGSIVLQSGQKDVSLPVQVTYRNPDPLGYQDVILFTDNGNGQFVALASQNFRLIRPNETIPVSAATLARGTPLAAGSIVSAFGPGLSSGTAGAISTPLPVTLAGTSVSITDATGQQLAAPLFFVSPGQVNLQIPAALKDGPASFSVLSGGKTVSGGSLTVGTPTPGLFTVHESGAGVVAAFYLRVQPDGSRVHDYVFNPQTLAATPLDVSTAAGQVYLELFGTGITGGPGPVTATVGGQDVPVLAAVPQGQFAGLDQVNIGPLPPSLAGSGEVPVIISAGGANSSSAATVFISGTSATVALTVQTNPVGLQARIGASGPYAPAPISQVVPANQTQTISVIDPQFSAASGTGYSFSGWSTGGSTAITTVQPASNFTATASFNVACYPLTVTVSPANSGTVVASPASGGQAGLPANCYVPGTTVTLTATGNAAQDFIFLGSWSGAGTGSTTRTVVMNGPSAVTANFSVYQAPNLNFGGSNWGYASGSTYQMIGKLGNNGADYNNIKITQVVWTAVAGTDIITDTTALPITIGNLAGGVGALSSSLTLNATMPTTVTQFKVCVSGTAVSPLSGNTVTWTDNQNCNHVFPRN